MMKRKKKKVTFQRILALMMALFLTLGNFTSLKVSAQEGDQGAAVSSAEVPESAGEELGEASAPAETVQDEEAEAAEIDVEEAESDDKNAESEEAEAADGSEESAADSTDSGDVSIEGELKEEDTSQNETPDEEPIRAMSRWRRRRERGELSVQIFHLFLRSG